MLCIGGPKHGEDIECRGPCFYALRERAPRGLYSTDPSWLPDDPIKTAKYERLYIKSDGKQIPVWVIYDGI
jgi:hypothetical protein